MGRKKCKRNLGCALKGKTWSPPLPSRRPVPEELSPVPGGLPVLGKSQHVGTSLLLTECGLGTDCSVLCFLHLTVILEMYAKTIDIYSLEGLEAKSLKLSAVLAPGGSEGGSFLASSSTCWWPAILVF